MREFESSHSSQPLSQLKIAYTSIAKIPHDSCQEGLRRAGRNDATDRQPSGWAKNACIEDRIEPLSPDKLRDTLSPNLRGIT